MCLKERFTMKDNVILTGFMGCGKTSVGIRLSYYLRRTMIDTDKWIERKKRMTISEIFEKEGEKAFRQMETDCLQELLKTADKQIISVGGGLPVKEENRQLLLKLGKVFYLKASPETIYERVKADTTRPLLQVADPLAQIKLLLGARENAYSSCADVTIDVSGKSFDAIIESIADNLQG